MKHARRVFSLFLALMLVLSVGTVFAAAAEPVTKTVTMLCYNVAGLPSVSGLMGQQGVSVSSNQCKLGKLLNQERYDVIAVQEDFNYDPLLRSGLTRYKYKTDWSGGIPGGDGMNIFATVPIYNAKRTPWDSTYGVIENGADELTPKGILYAVLDFGDGLLVDFYDIHADAFDDEGSIHARNDNFRQLLQMINARGTARPVIITGDFNTSTHLKQGNAYTQYMIEEGEFKDAWLENSQDWDYAKLKQYGATANDTSWGSSWGSWDSAEKFLYRDGGGIHIEATDFAYVDYQNGGASISDHKAASVRFTLTKTEDSTNPESLRVNHLSLTSVLMTKAVTTVRDICKILSKPNEILGLFTK